MENQAPNCSLKATEGNNESNYRGPTRESLVRRILILYIAIREILVQSGTSSTFRDPNDKETTKTFIKMFLVR